MRTLLPIILFLLSSVQGAGQHFLKMKGDKTPEGVRIGSEYNSSIERRKTLRELVRTSWSMGYLAAGIDSTRSNEDTLIAHFFRGKPYEWGRISLGEQGRGLVLDAGVKPHEWKGDRIDPEGFSKLYEQILDHCEQNGYPFAEVGLDSLQADDEGVHARLNLDKGPLVRLDTIIIEGEEDVVHRSFLEQYLGLKKGMIYDQRRFQRIDDRMERLSFLNPSQASQLLFTDEGVSVYLYPEERNASRFNGIVGLQPGEGEGDVVFTGDVTLALRNALNRGERIELDWERMKVGTQDLMVEYEHPYLFQTPFGVEAGLELYRQDSAFTELQQELALKYLFTGEDHFRVRYQRKEWTLLEGGEDLRRTDLPYADLRVNTYGIGFHKSAVDRRIMPTQGIRGDLGGSIGRKELLEERPAFLDEEEGASDSASLQYELEASLEAFWPVLPRLVAMVGVEGGWMQAPYLLSNELYRIGGHGSLRGMNKQAIRASAYSIATFELRYLLEERSDLHAFFDGAYHEDRSGGGLSLDRPFGFGVGARFETQAGIFNIDYALGKRFDQAISLMEGRVHFGFTSLF